MSNKVLEILNDKTIPSRYGDDYNSYWELIYKLDLDKSIEYEGLNITLVEEDGGCEGGGEHMSKVIEVKYDDKLEYYKIDGSYSSWDDSDWNEEGWYRVYPHEKVIVEYRK